MGTISILRDTGMYVINKYTHQGFPGGSDSKESTCSEGDLVPPLGWEDSLEKGMATHSSVLAWRLPWTEEPGGLQSIGSQRVRHDCATKHTHTQAF